MRKIRKRFAFTSTVDRKNIFYLHFHIPFHKYVLIKFLGCGVYCASSAFGSKFRTGRVSRANARYSESHGWTEAIVRKRFVCLTARGMRTNEYCIGASPAFFSPPKGRSRYQRFAVSTSERSRCDSRRRVGGYVHRGRNSELKSNMIFL